MRGRMKRRRSRVSGKGEVSLSKVNRKGGRLKRERRVSRMRRRGKNLGSVSLYKHPEVVQ